MDLHEQDAAWNLLKSAPPRRASGGFVSKVVREVRLLESSTFDGEAKAPRWTAWWCRYAVAGCAAAALLTVGVFLLNREVQHPAPELVQATEEVDALTEELEVMNVMDELLAVNDPSQTLDDAGLAELLFAQSAEF